MPRIYIVLGMHKSGTTLVSRLLHSSGIEMVDVEDDRTYDQGNQFERKSTSQFNKDLLNCEGKHSIEVPLKLNLAAVPSELRSAVEYHVGALCGAEKDWGFKDPRSCLTYDFWREVIPSHRLVVIFRDVSEVHGRYSKKSRLGLLRGVRTLKAWYVYNEACLNAYATADPKHRIILDYGDLMHGETALKRLSDFIERSPADLRSGTLKRSAAAMTLKLRADAALYKLFSGHDVFALQKRLKTL